MMPLVDNLGCSTPLGVTEFGTPWERWTAEERYEVLNASLGVTEFGTL